MGRKRDTEITKRWSGFKSRVVFKFILQSKSLRFVNLFWSNWTPVSIVSLGLEFHILCYFSADSLRLLCWFASDVEETISESFGMLLKGNRTPLVCKFVVQYVFPHTLCYIVYTYIHTDVVAVVFICSFISSRRRSRSSCQTIASTAWLFNTFSYTFTTRRIGSQIEEHHHGY